jgi:hypothetical protein
MTHSDNDITLAICPFKNKIEKLTFVILQVPPQRITAHICNLDHARYFAIDIQRCFNMELIHK